MMRRLTIALAVEFLSLISSFMISNLRLYFQITAFFRLCASKKNHEISRLFVFKVLLHLYKVAGRSLNLIICMFRGTCILQQIIDYESEHSG